MKINCCRAHPPDRAPSDYWQIQHRNHVVQIGFHPVCLWKLHQGLCFERDYLDVYIALWWITIVWDWA